MTDTTYQYLERALIGALLNEPHRWADLPTLTQRDFTDPQCRAVWQILATETRWSPGPVNVTDMAECLSSLGAELHPNLRSAAAVAELQVQAPVRPHPDAYAQMIIQETIRREVLALGYQLTQIDPAQPGRAIATIDAITAQIEAHRARAPLGAATQHAGNDSSRLPHGANETASGTPRTGEDGQQYCAEYAVLGAAIHDHPRGSRAHVQTCIMVNDLTRRDVRSAWTAINHMQAAYIPVDEITVYWHLTHSTAATPRAPITLAMLRDSRDASALHHEAVHTLTAASAARALTRLQTTITALGVHPGQPLPDTIDTITRTTGDLRQQAQRISTLSHHA